MKPTDRARHARRIEVKPQIRSTETYTEANFLRVHILSEPRAAETGGAKIVTIEHLSYRPADGGMGGWQCLTIVDGEEMSREDALFIAQSYARQNEIPVIYECHGE